MQEREGDGEVEAAGADTAGVEVEDAMVVVDVGAMRVTEDDDADVGDVRVEVEVVDGVEHVEETAGELNGFGGGELGAGAVGVDVAADGGDGRDAAEFGEDVGVADVAGVKDVIDTSEGGEELWAEETVGVRDHADEHARDPREDAVWGQGSRGGHLR
jgi:hypothetical protein